mgnify:CR=1 FL=1|jgi:hypothetical protein
MQAFIHVNKEKDDDTMKTASNIGDVTSKAGPLFNRANSLE